MMWKFEKAAVKVSELVFMNNPALCSYPDKAVHIAIARTQELHYKTFAGSKH